MCIRPNISPKYAAITKKHNMTQQSVKNIENTHIKQEIKQLYYKKTIKQRNISCTHNSANSWATVWKTIL
jgi:hypothetical protein